MIKIIKQLFCKHKWKFGFLNKKGLFFSLNADEEVMFCSKCGKIVRWNDKWW